jgi:hypothetical protein
VAEQAVWVYGDTAGPITATLQTDGAVQNLTGATVQALVRNVATNVVSTVSCTVVAPATSGVVEIPAATRAAWAAGSYALRFRVTYSNATVDIFPSDGVEPTAVVRPAWS